MSRPAAQTIGQPPVRVAAEEVLSIRDLNVHFPSGQSGNKNQPIRAVDGVSLSLRARETLALVGESGSGKSTIAKAIIGLVRPTSGEILYRGEDLLRMSTRRRKARTAGLQMVFQNARSSLNPSMRIRDCIAEPMVIHRRPASVRRKRVAELLDMVELTAAQGDAYPHQLSGGQQQRAGIARALSLEPSVLVLDEPVSALDISVQAQVLNLLSQLQSELGLAYLFISHDLAVVSSLADRVAVMFLGRLMETGSTDTVLRHSVHPYTQALISAIPVSEPRLRDRGSRIVLSGDLPSPSNPPSGCRFRTRCWRSQPSCAEVAPELEPVADTDHVHACLFPGELSLTPSTPASKEL